jgi:hypothetical protein
LIDTCNSSTNRVIVVFGELVVTANAVLLSRPFLFHPLVAVHARDQGNGFEVVIGCVQFGFVDRFIFEKSLDIFVE